MYFHYIFLMKMNVSSPVTISTFLFSIQMETHLSQQGSSGTSPSTLFSQSEVFSLPPSCYYVTGTCCIHRFIFRALLFFFLRQRAGNTEKTLLRLYAFATAPPPPRQSMKSFMLAKCSVYFWDKERYSSSTSWQFFFILFKNSTVHHVHGSQGQE